MDLCNEKIKKRFALPFLKYCVVLLIKFLTITLFQSYHENCTQQVICYKHQADFLNRILPYIRLLKNYIMKKYLFLLLAVTFAATGFSQSPTCNLTAIQTAMSGAGYQQLTISGQPCYLYFYNSNTTSNWGTAEQQAQAVGGHLLTINNAIENAAVVAAAQAAGLSGGVWIGYTDAAIEGTWAWVDGSNSPYTNWNGSEPSNSAGFPCYTDEDGGLLQLSNGMWNDLATNNGCPGATAFASIIKINLCPQITANGATGCSGQPTTINSVGSFGSRPYTYAWFSPPSVTPVDNDSSLTVTIAAPTVYVAAMQDVYGCSDTAMALINVTACVTPPGCNIAAIDAAMNSGGYAFLNVQNQPCSRYYFNSSPTSNWATAEQQANAVGGHLVSVNSAAENAALLTAAQAQGLTGAIWIGFTDAAVEGTFVWSNGSANTYSNWNGGEPSNSGGFPCNTDEDGTILQLSNGRWNDLALNNGCPGATQFRSVIEIDLCPVVNATAPSVAVCQGYAAYLTSSALLGSSPFTYQWSNVATNANVATGANVNVTPAANTSYQVQATDIYGCYARDTVSVITQVCTVISTCNIPAIDAAMAGAGFQFLNVPNYPCFRYYFNPNQTNSWNTASGQAAAVGATMLTVSSQAENDAVWQAAVAAGVSGGLWIGYTDQVTEGTWLWSDGSNGTFTNWNPGEPNNSTCFGSNLGEDASIIQMSNGRWNDVYTGPQGVCLSPASYASIVKVNLCPTATAVANPVTVCAGVSSSLTATTILGSPNYTYAWNNLGSSTSAGTGTPLSVSPVTTTSFEVVSTDRYSCQAKDTVLVTVAGATSQTFTLSPSPVCVGAAVTVTYTGPSPSTATFTWNFNGATIISGSGIGPYQISFSTSGNKTVTLDVNDNGCVSPQATQAITVNPSPVANAGPDVTTCSGAIINLGVAPVGGVTYVWVPANNLSANNISNPQFSAFNTSGAPVTYSFVMGAQALGCSAIDSVTVTVNPAPTASINPTSASVCSGNSTTLTASGGTGYVWSSGGVLAAETVTPAITTTYTVTVSIGANCTATASATVTINTSPTASINPNPVSVCGGNPATITASGGTSYTWSTGDTTAAITVSPASATTYTVTVTNANLCIATASVNATIFGAINPTINPAAASVCTGGSISITAGGGTSYTWSNAGNTATITVTPTTATTYTVTITDANGCTAVASSSVTINSPLATTISASSAISFCAGGSVTINADSVFTNYLWSDNSTSNSVSVSQTSTYTLSGTDATGCLYISNTITVTQNPNPVLQLVSSTNETCFGFADGTITVTANSGTPSYNFVWNTTPTQNSATASNLSAGSYDVTVTDANNCSSTGSYSITSPQSIVLNIDNATDISCFGLSDGTISASATGGNTPYNFVWNNGATTSVVQNLIAGTYTVTVSDANNCSADSSVTILEPAQITLQVLSADSISMGTEVLIQTQVQPAGNNYTYQWTPPNFLSCDNCANPTFSAVSTMQYVVVITDANGCMVDTNITIHVNTDKTVFIPNVFTPNGDGNNDRWEIFSSTSVYFNLKLFNRWGEKVFDSFNATEGWDGTYQGQDSYPGVYSYVMLVTFLDGENRQYIGTVTLLR